MIDFYVEDRVNHNEVGTEYDRVVFEKIKETLGSSDLKLLAVENCQRTNDDWAGTDKIFVTSGGRFRVDFKTVFNYSFPVKLIHSADITPHPEWANIQLYYWFYRKPICDFIAVIHRSSKKVIGVYITEVAWAITLKYCLEFINKYSKAVYANINIRKNGSQFLSSAVYVPIRDWHQLYLKYENTPTSEIVDEPFDALSIFQYINQKFPSWLKSAIDNYNKKG